MKKLGMYLTIVVALCAITTQILFAQNTQNPVVPHKTTTKNGKEVKLNYGSVNEIYYAENKNVDDGVWKSHILKTVNEQKSFRKWGNQYADFGTENLDHFVENDMVRVGPMSFGANDMRVESATSKSTLEFLKTPRSNYDGEYGAYILPKDIDPEIDDDEPIWLWSQVCGNPLFPAPPVHVIKNKVAEQEDDFEEEALVEKPRVESRNDEVVGGGDEKIEENSTTIINNNYYSSTESQAQYISSPEYYRPSYSGYYGGGVSASIGVGVFAGVSFNGPSWNQGCFPNNNFSVVPSNTTIINDNSDHSVSIYHDNGVYNSHNTTNSNNHTEDNDIVNSGNSDSHNQSTSTQTYLWNHTHNSTHITYPFRDHTGGTTTGGGPINPPSDDTGGNSSTYGGGTGTYGNGTGTYGSGSNPGTTTGSGFNFDPDGDGIVNEGGGKIRNPNGTTSKSSTVSEEKGFVRYSEKNKSSEKMNQNTRASYSTASSNTVDRPAKNQGGDSRKPEAKTEAPTRKYKSNASSQPTSSYAETRSSARLNSGQSAEANAQTRKQQINNQADTRSSTRTPVNADWKNQPADRPVANKFNGRSSNGQSSESRTQANAQPRQHNEQPKSNQPRVEKAPVRNDSWNNSSVNNSADKRIYKSAPVNQPKVNQFKANPQPRQDSQVREVRNSAPAMKSAPPRNSGSQPRSGGSQPRKSNHR